MNLWTRINSYLFSKHIINQNDQNSFKFAYSKRLIGRKYSDPVVQKDKLLWPFKVVAGTNDEPMIILNYKGGEKNFCAEEISSTVLAKMWQIAEAFLEKHVKNAVVTVPDYLNDSQYKATIDAGKIAGLNILLIINEPTAVAITYGFDMRTNNCVGYRNIFIFDLGGGTFDMSLLTLKGKMNTHMLLLPNIEVDVLSDGIDLCSSITRGRFEEINMQLFRECMTVDKCLTDAKMNKSSVHDVVLVGRSSRIPKVQELLQNFFDGKDLCKSINPDEAVAYRAAVQAALLTEGINNVPDLVLMDVTALTLGKHVIGDILSVIIPRNTTIPVKRTQEYVTVKDSQSSVRIWVYEGARARASDNKFLGSFSLSGLPPAPCGHPFNICFAIDENGILSVSAKEKTTGNSSKIIITNDRERLSTEEINRMIQEAEEYQAEDKKFLRKATAMNKLDDYVYKMNNGLESENLRSKLCSEDKEKISSAITKATKLIDGDNQNDEIDVFEDYMKELKNLFERVIGKFDSSVLLA